MSSVRVGIVGAGRVGQIAHLAHYVALPDVDVVLADLRPELAREVAQRYGIREVANDHRDMLARGVDALVVVVRRQATGPIVLDALSAGVHVLSEKPMALTIEDAARLAELAPASGVLYGVGYMKRCDAGVVAARELLRSRRAEGALGPLLDVEVWSEAGHDGSAAATFAMTEEPRPLGLDTWAAFPAWLRAADARAYEETLNVHSHATNLARWLLDAPARIVAARRDGSALHVDAEADGVPLRFTFRDDRRQEPWREGILVRFARGEVRIELPPPFAQDRAAAVVEATPHGMHSLSVDPDGGHFARQARAFVAAIRGDAPLPAAAHDAVLDVAFATDLWRLLGASTHLELA